MTATNVNLDETADRVRRRDASAVLRMSETAAENLDGNPLDPTDDERMIMNMGPAHPSTHGVLRLILELEGETVLRCKPVVGYLHTGMEKTGEQLSFLQGPTNVTRMDYSSPLFNELVFSMAVETLLEIEVPQRATWIRMMMCELNRMSSHLLFMATNGMDLGAVGMMIYGWREREEILRFFEKVTGLRMNHNYIRPGGVAADLPDNWQSDLTELLDVLPERLDEYDILMSGQPIWRDRLQGVGVMNTAEALALGATGPILRSTGHQWDLRRDEPYLAYDQVEFDVIVGTYGDSYDRYAIRLNEIRESLRIVRQCIEKMPKGDYRIQDKKVTPPPRARIDQSMEALIHHFKIFTEGFKVPEGEVYVAVESPRGELGCYLVSDGGAHPYRMHIRGPSFVNLQTIPYLLQGGVIADGVAAVSSVDPIMGEVDR
jgi:NADH-quinone oxidoreductase subunit D